MIEDNDVLEKIKKFLLIGLKYYGKEIALPSNQFFSIDELRDEKEKRPHFIMQYGFPQSGAVVLSFCFDDSKNSIDLTRISIHAPAADQEFILANLAPSAQFDEIGISINYGLDNNTVKHSSPEEIRSNPNAIKMLDMAIEDLSYAEILGDCRIAVPAGSDRIHCCNSTSKPPQR